jgi:hypothetical protein
LVHGHCFYSILGLQVFFSFLNFTKKQHLLIFLDTSFFDCIFASH